MKKHPPVDTRSLRELLQEVLFSNVFQYGTKARRERIMFMLKLWKIKHDCGIMINRMHCANLKRDPDLRKLLKLGQLRMVRDKTGYSNSVYQCLEINE